MAESIYDEKNVQQQRQQLFDYLMTGNHVTTMLLVRSPFNFGSPTKRISEVRAMLEKMDWKLDSNTVTHNGKRFKEHFAREMTAKEKQKKLDAQQASLFGDEE